MENGNLAVIAELNKALTAGGYSGAPDTLVQGNALQIENLSPVMQNVTVTEEHIKLQKMFKVVPAKSTLVQFDRILAYGIFGGSAQAEGQVGQYEDGDYRRITVPMCFYSHLRRVTFASNMVATVDGVKAEDREAKNAAIKLAGDIEFDLFRGKADFSNGGVFDGNLASIPSLPNILGLDVQIRSSDALSNTQDLMFAEYGSNISVVVPGGGTLTRANIEDAALRSALNMGHADKLLVDPQVLSAYNKLAFSIDRIVLAGSPQKASGADLRTQWTSSGDVSVEVSQFLRGKYIPARARANGPSAPTFTLGQAAGATAFTATQVYTYYVTSGNEIGESPAATAAAITVATTGNYITVTITPPGTGTARYFNVYRSAAGGSAASAKFIGRVANSGATTTVFTDLGNRLPGSVTGFLIQGDTAEMHELAPYSRKKIAIQDLSEAEAHFRFVTLAVLQPRKNRYR